MKSWRAIFAMELLLGSYLGLFCATLCIKNPAVQVFFFLLAVMIGMIALSMAQDDGSKRNKN